jgi:glycosyltransferase involved in cell wall biosynthesis
VRYWGNDNVLLVIEDEGQLPYLNSLFPEGIGVLIKPLHKYARLNHASFIRNMKELRHLARSVFSIFYLCLKNKGAGVTINSTEPIKLLYLFWLPFVKVCYILHTTPEPTDTHFTTVTCNKRLGRKKKIITVSEATKARLCQSWGIDEQKKEQVRVVHNCVPETSSVPATPVLPDVLGRIVLTMGYLIGYKNPAAWLTVARSVTAQREDVTFVWLGNGPLYAEFETETQNERRIFFLGLVDNPAKYLSGASIYYQPSLYETQGVAVLEAMSHELPCVVSDAGGLPESVTDGFNGFLAKADDVALQAGKILALLDDEALRKSYGRNGYEKYRGSYTYDAFKIRMDGIWAN